MDAQSSGREISEINGLLVEVPRPLPRRPVRNAPLTPLRAEQEYWASVATEPGPLPPKEKEEAKLHFSRRQSDPSRSSPRRSTPRRSCSPRNDVVRLHVRAGVMGVTGRGADCPGG